MSGTATAPRSSECDPPGPTSALPGPPRRCPSGAGRLLRPTFRRLDPPPTALRGGVRTLPGGADPPAAPTAGNRIRRGENNRPCRYPVRSRPPRVMLPRVSDRQRLAGATPKQPRDGERTTTDA